jgi:hypothetical protein
MALLSREVEGPALRNLGNRVKSEKIDPRCQFRQKDVLVDERATVYSCIALSNPEGANFLTLMGG